MGDFNLSVADSTPRAERGSVIRSQTQKASDETGKIVEDKEEVRIKDILQEMNVMSTVAQVGTVSQDTASGGSGFGSWLNMIMKIFDTVKNLASSSTGSSSSSSSSNTATNLNNWVTMVMNEIPKLTGDKTTDNKLLKNSATVLTSNNVNKTDPVGIFLTGVADLFTDLDSFLDSEYTADEKYQIIQNLGVQEFFNEFQSNISDYTAYTSSVLATTGTSISAAVTTSVAETTALKESIEKLTQEQEENIAYNKAVQAQREKYKTHILEEEVSKLQKNPTEDRIINTNEYSKNLSLLRSKTTGG